MEEVKLKLHNDGKEKWQSFEMYVDMNGSLYGYGQNEEEAKEELKEKVNALIDKLKSIDFDDPEIVDYKGDKIAKFW